ncbi:MAG: hypothetical protein Q8O88_00740 [bacterium]|nr:hypothetical protein [bacterium]
MNNECVCDDGHLSCVDCPVCEERFSTARENLGFGFNDDLNYYGDDESRYGQPLNEDEITQLNNEIQRLKDEQ